MKLFDDIQRLDIIPETAKGCTISDIDGKSYLDLCAGNGVVSVGHSHPHYVSTLAEQLQRIVYCADEMANPLKQELARKLGRLCGYEDYSLLLCNSASEANDYALRLSSFITGKDRIIAFKGSSHGSTLATAAASGNTKSHSTLESNIKVTFAEINDAEAVKDEFSKGDVAAVIVEGMQTSNGIVMPQTYFMQELQRLCNDNNAVLIIDEVQSGYGRTGKFFAHQWHNVQADIITVAGAMGNGLPIGGVITHPKFEKYSGGIGNNKEISHISAAAAIAVADIIGEANLIGNAQKVGQYIIDNMPKSSLIKAIKGKGLLIGIELERHATDVRKKLLANEQIFTGISGQSTIKLTPPLTLTLDEADIFLTAFARTLADVEENEKKEQPALF
ncbi:MAG: aspartate aminotransferase family protein [Prevotellaceae bacterium]|nr:aspartate aminotransferase family protein [Prevotellaceae bacterium]